MGGIAGILDKRGLQDLEKHAILQMLRAISHRGTIQSLQRCGLNVLLGGLSEKDDKHFEKIAFDESEGICVVMDGEIFFEGNRSSGLCNQAKSDAEVLLSTYLKNGMDFLDGIDGSCSIAIWDSNQDTIILIRDRLGTKPLFYLVQQDLFVFASEIKAILESSVYEPSVNPIPLNNFLSYGYIPAGDTMFEAIHQVKPGTILMWKEGEVVEKSYWKFTYHPDQSERPESYYEEEFLKIFESAVAKRLKRFPEAGAFLSGGLDSSAVVAMMHKLKGNSLEVFTAGFKEKAYDEIDEAKIFSDSLCLDHYATIIDFDRSLPELLQKLVWHHDAPFADTSAIPSYFAAKLAKEHVDVVFTGDFPDQLIGGSGHHVLALDRERHDPLWKKGLKNKKLNRLISSLPLSAGGATLFDKIKRSLYRESFSLEEQRIILGMPIPPLLKRCLYSPDLLEVNKEYDPLEIARSLYKEVEDEGLLNKLLYFDIYSYAPDDLMVKVDRMTSAHGLTAISPFYDRRFVEFMATVPADLKIRGQNRKYIMREALRPMLPEQTLNKKKQGFAMPIGEWLINNLSDYVRDVLLDSRTLNRGYFNKKFMRKMVGSFLAGKTDYASGSEAAIISLITLELWHRMFVDR